MVLPAIPPQKETHACGAPTRVSFSESFRRVTRSRPREAHRQTLNDLHEDFVGRRRGLPAPPWITRRSSAKASEVDSERLQKHDYGRNAVPVSECAQALCLTLFKARAVFGGEKRRQIGRYAVREVVAKHSCSSTLEASSLLDR